MRSGRRVLLGAALAVVLAAGAVFTVLLIREAQAPRALARLEAEAVAAAENLFHRIDQADATGNPALLEGVYLPGSKIAETQQGFVMERAVRGEVSTAESKVTGTQAISVDPSRARVRLTYVVTRAEIRDARTGSVKRSVTQASTTTYVVSLRRIDGRWLVDDLAEATP